MESNSKWSLIQLNEVGLHAV